MDESARDRRGHSRAPRRARKGRLRRPAGLLERLERTLGIPVDAAEGLEETIARLARETDARLQAGDERRWRAWRRLFRRWLAGS